MPNPTYPLDVTGVAASNLISNEQHTVTEVNAVTYNLIVPKFAPFHLENFKLRHVAADGTVSILDEGIHFTFALPYIAATRSIGKMIYGAISINAVMAAGTYYVDYQTIGDKWCADSDYVLTILAEQVYNAKTTVWDNLTNVQEIFPVINHNQDFDYVYGQAELIDALASLGQAIADNQANRPQMTWPALTKYDVGLGNVDNTDDLHKPISIAVQAALDAKEDKGNQNTISLKTINGESLFGTGDIVINGGSGNGSAVPNVIQNGVIDCSLGSFYILNLTNDVNISFSNVDSNIAYDLTLVVNATNGLITWPSSVCFENETVPSITPNRKHLFKLVNQGSGNKWLAYYHGTYFDNSGISDISAVLAYQENNFSSVVQKTVQAVNLGAPFPGRKIVAVAMAHDNNWQQWDGNSGDINTCIETYIGTTKMTPLVINVAPGAVDAISSTGGRSPAGIFILNEETLATADFTVKTPNSSFYTFAIYVFVLNGIDPVPIDTFNYVTADATTYPRDFTINPPAANITIGAIHNIFASTLPQDTHAVFTDLTNEIAYGTDVVSGDQVSMTVGYGTLPSTGSDITTQATSANNSLDGIFEMMVTFKRI